MIRTKKYLMREISRLRKTKKRLQEELDTLKKMEEMKSALFTKTGNVLRKEILSIEGTIKGILWVANTNQKTLPKIKTKTKKAKPEK